jgi:HlyD family secretion protein
LAEDLAKMELRVDVDEADVGQVTEGQDAVFTVDAYPGMSFWAKVTKVRYGPQTVNGVVTYETALNVDNSNLLLRPGMTATADITVKTVEDALLVPNAALRFSPPVEEKEGPAEEVSITSKLLPRAPRHSRSAEERESESDGRKIVWTLRDGIPVSIPLTVGSTDGEVTEALSGEIEPGTLLVVGIEEPIP